MNKLCTLVLFIGLLSPAFAQEKTKTKTSARPDIPGTIMLEFGFNGTVQPPANFKTALWGSTTFNIYYQYPIRLFNSKFSVVPGIGFSFERFKLKNKYILKDYIDSVRFMPPVVLGYPGIKKSKLITDYVEIPLEFRFDLNPEDPSRSFNISIGGRVGFLMEGLTKIKYHEDGETKKLKDNQNFNLTQFRYGLTSRIGFGSFSIFGYYNLNYLFEKNKGPVFLGERKNTQTFTVGISLASF